VTDRRLTLTAAAAVSASALTLAPAFQTPGYFWPCLGAVLAVAAAGHGARRLGLPRPVVLVATLAALAGYLTFAYARADAVLWVVPGPGAVRALSDLASSGMHDISRFAAPVRPYHGIVAITAAGVGAVAVLVDLFAVTYRRAAFAGLPLFVLYCVPAAVVPDGVGWLAFVVAACGYLALLLADSGDRVRRWGRPLGHSVSGRSLRSQDEDVDTRSLGQVGRRVGAAALGVAVVVPAMLPSLDSGVLGTTGHGFGHGNGSRTVNVVNPIVDLKRDLVRPRDRVVIHYKTDDPDPGYLRMVTLDTFDGESWTPAELNADRDQNVDHGLPAPIGLSDTVRSTRRHTTIEVGDLRDSRLPMPYPAATVRADGEWLYDDATRNVFSVRNDIRGLDYTVESLDVDYNPDDLRAVSAIDPSSSGSAYTKLPSHLPSLVRRLTTRVTAGASTDYDKALAIQEWLRNDFVYSLRTQPGNSRSDLLSFLHDRSGYCEQFAATMAIMARLSGIPTRVDVGFTAGHRLPDGTWQVTLHDAHAWPELYFPGVGWVPFEPTPRADGTTPAPAYANEQTTANPDPSSPGGGAGGGQTAAGGHSSNQRATGHQLDLQRQRLANQLDSKGVVPPSTQGQGGLPVVPLVVAGVVLLLAALPATSRALVRTRRRRRIVQLRGTAPQAGVEIAWSELEDTAWDHGLARRPSETPRGFVDHLVRSAALSDADAAAAGRLAEACEQSRFARSLGTVGDLGADLAAVRAGLSRSAGLRARWRARVLPASTRALATWVAERVADSLDWVDSLGGRTRVALARRVPGRRAAGDRS